MSQAHEEMGIVVRKAGGPEALEWTALESPVPGPGEARIAQRAVGVNFLDTYYRGGSYPWPPTPPLPGAAAARGGEGGGGVWAPASRNSPRAIGWPTSCRSAPIAPAAWFRPTAW